MLDIRNQGKRISNIGETVAKRIDDNYPGEECRVIPHGPVVAVRVVDGSMYSGGNGPRPRVTGCGHADESMSEMTRLSQ